MNTSERVTRSELGRILTAKGPIDLSSIPTTYRSNGWYIGSGTLRWHTSNSEIAIELLNIHDKNPPLVDLDIRFTMNRRPTNFLDKEWVLARLAELSFHPPEITKAEIMAEIEIRGEIKRIPGDGLDRTPYEIWYQYGDKVKYMEPNSVKGIWIELPLTQPSDITLIKNGGAVNVLNRVWVLARLAELPYAAAPLPPLTPSAQSPEMCRWIKSIMAKGLTEDHGRYVYQLAKGRATLAASILTIMRVAPFMLPAIIVTEDIGRAIYQYAKGRKSLGNKITGCNF